MCPTLPKDRLHDHFASISRVEESFEGLVWVSSTNYVRHGVSAYAKRTI